MTSHLPDKHLPSTPDSRRQTEGGQPSPDPGTQQERLHPENEELDPTRQRELDDQVDKHRDDSRR